MRSIGSHVETRREVPSVTIHSRKRNASQDPVGRLLSPSRACSRSWPFRQRSPRPRLTHPEMITVSECPAGKTFPGSAWPGSLCYLVLRMRAHCVPKERPRETFLVQRSGFPAVLQALPILRQLRGLGHGWPWPQARSDENTLTSPEPLS